MSKDWKKCMLECLCEEENETEMVVHCVCVMDAVARWSEYESFVDQCLTFFLFPPLSFSTQIYASF